MDEYVKKEDLPGIIRDAVKQALDEYQHKCRLQISDEDMDQVKFVFHAIREIGHGRVAEGVTEVRENHLFLSKYRKWTGNIGTVVVTAIILGVLGVVGTWVASIAGGPKG